MPNLIYINQKENEQLGIILALAVICSAIIVTKHKKDWKLRIFTLAATNLAVKATCFRAVSFN